MLVFGDEVQQLGLDMCFPLFLIDGKDLVMFASKFGFRSKGWDGKIGGRKLCFKMRDVHAHS